MIDHVGYGLVEGFYGPPWSHATRTDVVRRLGELGLSTYFYAPKSDPKHRDRWWEPLAPGERADLERLFEAARTAGVRVIYGIAPERLMLSGNLRVRTARDLDGPGPKALLDRLLDVARVGGRDFAVLFDDTFATLAPWLAGARKGKAHGLVTRFVRDELEVKIGGTRVFLVPAVYHRRAREASAGALAYLEGIASMARDVPIAWTGPRIFSSWISSTDLNAWARATGLEPWVWNNLIANDWLPIASGESLGARGSQRLAFGPVDNVDAAVIGRSRGVLLNGAREPMLSVISAATLAELVRDGHAYDPAAAFDRALARVAGEGARDVVRELHAWVARHPLAAPHRGSGGRLDDALRDAEHRAGLRSHAIEIADALTTLERRLTTALGATPLADELRPTALKLELVGRAVRATLEGDAAAPDLARRARAIRWQTDADAALTRVRRRAAT